MGASAFHAISDELDKPVAIGLGKDKRLAAL
jgi:hypothetical protein